MNLLDVVVMLWHCHWLPLNLFYDLRRNSGDKRAWRYVLCDNCASGNYRTFADGDAWKNLNACAEPHIVADGDGLRVFKAFVVTFGVQRMSCRVEAAIWGDKDILSNDDLRAIEDDDPMIRVEVVAECNVRAVVAPERRLDASARADAPDYLAQLCVLRSPVVGLDLVVFSALVLALVHEPNKFRIVVGVIKFASVTQFLVGHCYFPFSKSS